MRVGLALAVAALAVATVACGPIDADAPSPSAPEIRPSASPASAAPSASAVPPDVPALIDPSLLELLPATIDGLPLTPAPDSDALVAGDPAIVADAEGAATALAIDQAAGQFAHVTLVRLRPAVMSDAYYRGWRDSFDDAACEQAGGVVRRAEAEIAGRPTFIATCAGGLRTYHAWLPGERILVSVSSLGDRRLGEQLIAALRE